jgi:hypothetical protein
MSHTTVQGTKTELEHIELAKDGFSAIAESLKIDLAMTVSPESKVALVALLEHAESGRRLAERCRETILASSASHSSSH